MKYARLPRSTADIVTDALSMAWFGKRPAAGRLPHSDRGSQSARQAFPDKLKACGMTDSMSRKGHCRENKRSTVSRAVRREGEARHNTPTERRFNRFRNERVQGVHHTSHARIKATTLEYIEVFCHRKRLHPTLGDRSLVQLLENWISQHPQEKLLA